MYEYWFGIADALRDGGATVFVTEVSQLNSTEARGEQLIDQIEHDRRDHRQAEGQPDRPQPRRARRPLRRGGAAGPGRLGDDGRQPAQGRRPRRLPARATCRTARSRRTCSPTSPTRSAPCSACSPATPIRRTRSPALDSLTSAGHREPSTRSYPQGVPTTACGSGAATVNGIRYYSWSGTGVLTNALDVSDAALGLTLALLPRGERRPGRPLQLAPRHGDPRQLLPEPPRRGEPGPRPGLDLRVEPDVGLPRARQPPEERRAVALPAPAAGLRRRRGAAAARSSSPSAAWPRPHGGRGAPPARRRRLRVRRGGAARRARRAPSRARVAARCDRRARRRARRRASRRAAAPGSLRDTEVDGALAVDANGRLLITPELRRFFDYFFVASGEESDEQIRARIEAEIRARLDGDRSAHRATSCSIASSPTATAAAPWPRGWRPTIATPASRRCAACAARCSANAMPPPCSPTRRRSYAAAVAERRIARRPGTERRRAGRAARRARRRAAGTGARGRAGRHARRSGWRATRRRCAPRAAPPRRSHALREQAVGAEAAARLAALDAQRAAWRSRVDAYRQERAAIDADPALDDARNASSGHRPARAPLQRCRAACASRCWIASSSRRGRWLFRRVRLLRVRGLVARLTRPTRVTAQQPTALSPMDPITALGLTAATLTTCSFVPQLAKVWRTKSADDLSYGMFAVFSLGILLWLIYGLLRADVPLIVANGITLMLSVAILVLKIRYGRYPRTRRSGRDGGCAHSWRRTSASARPTPTQRSAATSAERQKSRRLATARSGQQRRHAAAAHRAAPGGLDLGGAEAGDDAFGLLRGREAPQRALGERDRLVEAAVGEQGVAVAQLLAGALELVGGEALVRGALAGLARRRARGGRRGCGRRWRRPRPAPSRVPTRDGRRPRS